jgi:large conductance mechanosensitive channel
MKILKEFREFAMRGSVVDLAVGVIIGGAFQKIISSFVADVLTPPISLLTGGGNFAERAWTIRAAMEGQSAIVLKYGLFVQNVVDFILLAFVIFLMVKGINSVRRRPETAAGAAQKPAPTSQEKLLTEIRDLLKDRRETKS